MKAFDWFLAGLTLFFGLRLLGGLIFTPSHYFDIPQINAEIQRQLGRRGLLFIITLGILLWRLS